ncbi:MAG: peptidase inhibitor family I36 protein [Devosiaceae bacterium]|nr:peptidase inhibitor family I36 protein [Devosiaceae bacterium]
MQITAQRILIIFFSLLAMLALPTAVQAHAASNPAWALASVSLQSGPGTRYNPTQSSVFEGQKIAITRCTNRWCTIEGSEGWLSIDNISFGQTASSAFSGPKFNTGRGGDGEICLFDGENYSGSSVCLSSGNVARDLALLGWDNKISSVSVGSGVSVNLCRDRDFSSLCVLIDQSTPKMQRLLSNSASSWRVY